MAAKVDAEEKPNTFDPKRVEKIVGAVEEAIDARLSHKMEYIESCKAFNEAVNEAYNEGKLFGIPKKVLKAKIKERALRRELDGIADDLEEEQRETFEQVSQALGEFGDLPLGRAAKERAAKADEAAEGAPPKRGPGRPRKAPSPEASVASALASDEPEDDTENPIFKQGYEARLGGTGCAIPNELTGDDRDFWHNGWLAADGKITGDANAERLGAGISALN